MPRQPSLQVNSVLYELEREGMARRQGTKQGSSKPLWRAAA